MTSAFWLSGEFANKREDRTDHVIRNTFVEDEIRYDKIQAAFRNKSYLSHRTVSIRAYIGPVRII